MPSQDPRPFISSISHNNADPFRLLVESVLDYAIFMLDPAGHVASWNPGAERIYGYKTDEIIGRHFSVFYPDGDTSAVDSARELGSVEGIGRFEEECLRVRKDGTTFWAIITVTPLKDHFGRHIGFAIVTRDITELQNATNQIRRERDLSTSILSSLPGVYYVYDDTRKFLRWNREFEKVTEYTPADMETAHPLDFFADEDKARVAERIDEVFSAGRSSVEANFVSKSGRRTPYYFTGIRSEIGGKVCLLGMGIDISGRRDAETELLESRERLNLFITHAPAALAMFDREMRYLAASRRWLSDYQLPEADIIGRSHYEIFPEIGEEWRELHRRGLGGEVLRREEDLFRRADGREQWLHWEIRPWRDADESIGGIVIFTEDITERKFVQEALRKSEARLRTIVETEPECVKLLSADGTLLEMNSAGLRMIEADTFEAVKDHCIYPLIDDQDRPAFTELNERVFAGESGSLEFRLVGLKGGVRWAETHVSPLRDETDVVVAALGVTRDITQRKTAERALQESEARFRIAFEKAAFAAALSRESDGTITSVNERFIEIFGYSEDEVIGRTAVEIGLYSEGIRNALLAEFYANGTIRNFELVLKIKSGATRTMLVNFDLVEIGGERYALSTATDITESKRAQDALRESEARLRMALDAARIGTYDWDVRTGRITWSRWHEELWGYAPGEFAGNYESFAERIHPDDLGVLNKAIQQCIENRSHYSMEFRVVWPDGSVHWMNGIGEFEFAADGKPIRMLGAIAEITDRKHAEAALAERATLASLNAEVALSLSRTTDLRDMLRECVEALVRSLGTGMAFIWTFDRANNTLILQAGIESEVASGADLGRVRVGDSAIGRIAAHRKPLVTSDLSSDDWNGLERIREKGFTEFAGYPLLVEARLVGVVALFSRQPLPDAIRSAMFSIADTLSVGIERKRSDTLLQSVVDNVVDGVISIDETGVIHSFNAAAEKMFGYREAEVLGRNISILMGEPYSSGHDDFISNYLRTGDAKIIGIGRQVEARRSDGTGFPVQLGINEFSIDGKRHFTGVVRDITKEQQLESQLRQSQKMEAIGQLAGGIAHDFNNVLTVILGYSELLLKSTSDGDPKRRSLNAIHEAGERAASLTNQLLAFSRKAVVQPQKINVNSAVRDAEKLLRRLIGADIEFTVVPGPTAGNVLIDPGQFSQVVMNLAVNGRDAMPTGGQLTIETFAWEVDEARYLTRPYAQVGKYSVVAVTDSGHGMTEEVKARVFEPFFTTKGLGKGTGLGLATVYGIVKQNGGHIEVYSEVGRGTTFKVYLPSSDSASAEIPEAPDIAVPRGTETILVVEDETMVRDLAVEMLKALGYTVLSAADAREAQLLVEETREIDLLFTDIVMPGLSGTELAKVLTSKRPEMKVLFASGYPDDAVFRHGLVGSGSSYLQKPYSPQVLARKIREVLDGD